VSTRRASGPEDAGPGRVTPEAIRRRPRDAGGAASSRAPLDEPPASWSAVFEGPQYLGGGSQNAPAPVVQLRVTSGSGSPCRGETGGLSDEDARWVTASASCRPTS